MSEKKIYIFGTPNHFDLYQGSAIEIDYFQTFYNGSKENKKLVVHRMESGQISYSYLRYNFISGSGRANAFFGMSVVFNKEYCADIENLYKLFDSVFGTILQNRILFEKIKGNPNSQAKYLVQNFADAESEVKRIEKIIYKNIENEFADDIHTINDLPQILQKNSNINVKLNDKKDNSVFLKALCEYSWISISPEYNIDEKDTFSNEAIAGVDEKIDVIQKNVINISISVLKGIDVQEDIQKVNKQIQNGVNFIKPNLQIQPELVGRNNKLLDLRHYLEDITNILKDNEQKIITDKNRSLVEDKKENNADAKPEDEELNVISPKKRQSRKNIRPIFIIITIVICIIGYLLFNSISNQSSETIDVIPSTNVIDTEALVYQGQSFFDENKFDEAIKMFEKSNRSDLVTIAKSKAIDDLNQSAADAGKAGTVDKWQEAIQYLEKTRKYGNTPDEAIAEYQKKMDNEAKSKPKLIEQRKSQVEKPTLSYTNVTIQLSPNKRIFSKGDLLMATALSDGVLCKGGEWRYEEGLSADKLTNPTKVAIISVPESGKARLNYYINGEKVAEIEIRIVL